MITIKTESSRIVYSNGQPATGFLLITPSDTFTFLDMADQQRKRVSIETQRVNFANGQLSAVFQLAPTSNAMQDKTNLYYIVDIITNSSKVTLYWIIDAEGPDTLEFSDVVQTVIEPQVSLITFVRADDVSATPQPNMVPRADENGVIDLGWFTSIPLNQMIYGYIGNAQDFVIPGGAFGLISDTVEGQGKFWDGSKMNVLSGGTGNAGLNSALPIKTLGIIGNPLPDLTSDVLAIGQDVGEAQFRFWDAEKWNTFADALSAPDYLVGTSIIVPLLGVIGAPLPNLPQNVIALGNDVGESQKRVWDGYRWHTFA